MITVFTGADDSGDGWQLKWEGEEHVGTWYLYAETVMYKWYAGRP